MLFQATFKILSFNAPFKFPKCNSCVICDDCLTTKIYQITQTGLENDSYAISEVSALSWKLIDG